MQKSVFGWCFWVAFDTLKGWNAVGACPLLGPSFKRWWLCSLLSCLTPPFPPNQATHHPPPTHHGANFARTVRFASDAFFPPSCQRGLEHRRRQNEVPGLYSRSAQSEWRKTRQPNCQYKSTLTTSLSPSKFMPHSHR
jgi:hypothetical protein